MESRLKQLTDKIYREGIEKVKLEAEQILINAKDDANRIIKEAQAEAEELLEEATLETKQLHENTKAELKLVSEQVISKLKQDLTELITASVVQPKVKEAFNDKEFLQKMIEMTISKWAPDHHSVDLTIFLPEHKEELSAYFTDQIHHLLQTEVDMEITNGMQKGFRIHHKEDSYFISFTDYDFEVLFKNYLRPKTIELIYG